MSDIGSPSTGPTNPECEMGHLVPPGGRYCARCGIPVDVSDSAQPGTTSRPGSTGPTPSAPPLAPTWASPSSPPPEFDSQSLFPQAGPPAAHNVQQGRSTNGLAIASLVLGILWVWWVGSVLALIFGYVSLRQIRQRGESGKGMAIAGIVLGWVGVGLLVLLIIIGAVTNNTNSSGAIVSTMP